MKQIWLTRNRGKSSGERLPYIRGIRQLLHQRYVVYGSFDFLRIKMRFLVLYCLVGLICLCGCEQREPQQVTQFDLSKRTSTRCSKPHPLTKIAGNSTRSIRGHDFHVDPNRLSCLEGSYRKRSRLARHQNTNSDK